MVTSGLNPGLWYDRVIRVSRVFIGSDTELLSGGKEYLLFEAKGKSIIVEKDPSAALFVRNFIRKISP